RALTRLSVRYKMQSRAWLKRSCSRPQRFGIRESSTMATALVSASASSAARAAPSRASPPDGAPIVHVVDDDDRGLAALTRLLRAHGFDARGYTSGAEFLLARGGEGPS